ncbi:microtubule-associated serine/threonine-protein kinase 4-like [Protopterus annectens]|uniref:microtubule-associated serine/threonine-protein kinase 4-like n=1 Tax=Protopterus annectens TaxID=7888 RepID=UPI001CFC3416|nr:microtubule-associated serine/threonine-protein kinase 4-like [Protopterus annectens]
MVTLNEDFEEECAFLHNMFINRGYPNSFLHAIFQEVTEKRNKGIYKPILNTVVVSNNPSVYDTRTNFSDHSDLNTTLIVEQGLNDLDHSLHPPCVSLRKWSSPDVSCGNGKTIKYKRQLSEDGKKQLRRGSLGGALTGKYLLPYTPLQQAWQAMQETSNLTRMRSQSLGQSAPSLTASLVSSNTP